MRPSVKPMPKPKVDLDQPIFPQGVINVDEDSQTGPSETASSEVTVKKENFDVAASGSGGVKPEDHSAASASAGRCRDEGGPAGEQRALKVETGEAISFQKEGFGDHAGAGKLCILQL
eukprot:s2517_g6.t1